MTMAEKILWQRIRKQQIQGVRFYRQKVIGHYIVDFYAPSVGLIVEIDGIHHEDPMYSREDKVREIELKKMNLRILRFSNHEVVTSVTEVVAKIILEIQQSSATTATLGDADARACG